MNTFGRHPMLGLIGIVLAFHAPSSSIAQSPNISIYINAPAANATVGDVLPVSVSVSSTYEIQTVSASLGGITTNLIFGSGWTNTLSLASLSRGSNTLLVTARDAFGNTAQTQRVVMVDRKPVLVVSSPMNGTVGRPVIRIQASASDDDPVGCIINVAYYDRLGAIVLLTRTNVVDEELSLASYGDRTMVFQAVDSAGQRVYVDRSVYFEPSSNLLNEVVVSGLIQDTLQDRILHILSADAPGAGANYPGNPQPGLTRRPLDASAFIRSRSSGEDTVLPRMPDRIPYSGLLTEGGALLGYTRTNYDVGAYVSDPHIVEWQNGTLTDLGPIYATDPKVKGRFAIWAIASELLVLRDLAARSNVVINAPGLEQGDFDVGPNGDVIYRQNGGPVYRNRPANPALPLADRATTQLAPSGVSVQTDGENVVFTRNFFIILYRTNEVILANFTGFPYFQPAYLLNQGWIAFNRPSVTGVAQVWVRSPSGTESQKSFYSIDSTPLAVGQSFDVVFETYYSPTIPPTTYSRDGLLARALSSTYHWGIFWQDGTFYTRLGRSLLRVADDRLALSIGTNGTTHLSLKSPVGAPELVQVSSNLVQWSDLIMVTNQTGVLQFDDPEPAHQPLRYYRTKF